MDKVTEDTSRIAILAMAELSPTYCVALEGSEKMGDGRVHHKIAITGGHLW